MIYLLGLEEAKTHLRVSGDDKDDEVMSKIAQASAIVLDYLEIDDYDESPQTGGPENMRAATFLVLGDLWEQRESGISNPLSPSVVALLARMRDPALA